MVFEGRNRSCLCVCFAQHVSCNLPTVYYHCFASSLYTLYLSIDSLCFKPILTMDAAAQIPPCRLLSLYIPMYMCVYIANTFASHNGRFRSCEFRNFSSSYASILATVYDSNLNFSVARIFNRFCFSVNCERALN